MVEVVGGELEGAFHRSVQVGAARLVDIGGEGAGDALDAHAHPRQAGLEGHAEGAALGVDRLMATAGLSSRWWEPIGCTQLGLSPRPVAPRPRGCSVAASPR